MLLLPSKFFFRIEIFFFSFQFLLCAISCDRLDASTKTASVEFALSDERKIRQREKKWKWAKKKEKRNLRCLKNPNTFQRENSIELGPRNDAESVRLATALGGLATWQVARDSNRSSSLYSRTTPDRQLERIFWQPLHLSALHTWRLNMSHVTPSSKAKFFNHSRFS